jgi:N6-adenosine-specific RNA methylase IME4
MTGAHGKIRGAASFYRTMPLEEIKALPVSTIADDNCILFLWITMPLLQYGLDVIEAWSFQYKTCGFAWIKTTKNNKLHFGMGHYTRGNAELCLIGTKGNFKRQNNSISQIVTSPVRQHSQKPVDIRRKIVTLCGDLPRIELFAREIVNGWDSWGDEI